MSVVETAILFDCAHEVLPAIVSWPAQLHAEHARGADTAAALPESSADTLDAASYGVLIVVGGPQYRVGSHRQFLHLARRLAAAGYPAMRFDYRGMGDGGGAIRPFDQVGEDIGAAIDAFQRCCPPVRRVILWGLCDAASAALLYVEASGDERVAGLVVLNPWVRSETSLAQTQIKHYYGQRLLKREFWLKLFRGQLAITQSLRSLLRAAITARRGRGTKVSRQCFQERMAAGWRHFSGRLLLVLSGEDYTAKEFLEFVRTSPAWTGLLEASNVRRVDLDDADHTFSSEVWRKQVEDATLAWLDTLSAT